ncbi:unnamed protein product, partial [Iphiclides podalirius]
MGYSIWQLVRGIIKAATVCAFESAPSTMETRAQVTGGARRPEVSPDVEIVPRAPDSFRVQDSISNFEYSDSQTFVVKPIMRGYSAPVLRVLSHGARALLTRSPYTSFLPTDASTTRPAPRRVWTNAIGYAQLKSFFI